MYFKTYLTCVFIINGLTSFYNIWKHHVSYFFSYFFQDHSTWYLIPGHSFPLSSLHVKHIENYVFLKECWQYHERNHTLSHNIINDWKRVPWLSAKLSVSTESENIEYGMDEFLDVFRFEGSPTLSLVFLSWCIHAKQWFSPFSIVSIHVINEMGEDVIFTLDTMGENPIIKIRI